MLIHQLLLCVILEFSLHNYFFLSPPLSLHPPTSISVFQAILCDVPRLQYVIVVDTKPTSWSDIPRGITIYNMDTVRDMGSTPDNSEHFGQRD